MKQVMTEDFRNYSTNVIKNAQALAAELIARGEKLISGGTDNHIVLWDVRQHELTGSKVQFVLDAIHITTNKNSVVGDKS